MRNRKTFLVVFLVMAVFLSGVSGSGESVSNPEWPLGLLITGEDREVSCSLVNNFIFDLDLGEEFFSGHSSLEVEAEKDFNFGSLYLNPRVNFYYGADSADPELELNEGYLDVYLDKMDFRFGKQRVTWGKADGLVITNVVNPQDLTTYPVIDFYEDRFKNMYMVKMDYYQGMDTWEGVWIPEFEPVSISDKAFKVQLEQIKNALPKEISGKFDPSKIEIKKEGIDSSLDDSDLDEGELGFDLEETEYALQYSSMGTEFDYEIMGGYLWDDYPTLHLDLDIEKSPQIQDPLKKISPSLTLKHHRLSLVGGSASTSMGDFVLRGETLFTHGKRYNRQINIDPKKIPNDSSKLKPFLNSLADSFVVEKDQFEWMFGVDYSVDYLVDLLKFQIDQDVILDYEDSIITDEYTTKMTFMAQGQYMRNDLTATGNLIYDLNHESLMSKLQLDYNYNSSMNFVIGLDQILEEGGGLFSILNRDALYIQAEYLF